MDEIGHDADVGDHDPASNERSRDGTVQIYRVGKIVRSGAVSGTHIGKVAKNTTCIVWQNQQE